MEPKVRLEGLNPETTPVMVFGDNLGVNLTCPRSSQKLPTACCPQCKVVHRFGLQPHCGICAFEQQAEELRGRLRQAEADRDEFQRKLSVRGDHASALAGVPARRIPAQWADSPRDDGCSLITRKRKRSFTGLCLHFKCTHSCALLTEWQRARLQRRRRWLPSGPISWGLLRC